METAIDPASAAFDLVEAPSVVAFSLTDRAKAPAVASELVKKPVVADEYS